MLYTAHTQVPCHASVEKFSLLHSKPLCGKALRDILTLQNSITRYGLLSPIIAIKRAGTLVVVDGRKRLAAIKRLTFEGRLPRSLVKIPYLLVTDMREIERRTPVLVSNRALYDALTDQFQSGSTVDDLADHFKLSSQCVRDILTLSRLSPQIRSAFFSKMISFAQARAYAALPDMQDQIICFNDLGPFAKPDQILEGPANSDTPDQAIAA